MENRKTILVNKNGNVVMGFNSECNRYFIVTADTPVKFVKNNTSGLNYKYRYFNTLEQATNTYQEVK